MRTRLLHAVGWLVVAGCGDRRLVADAPPGSDLGATIDVAADTRAPVEAAGVEIPDATGADVHEGVYDASADAVGDEVSAVDVADLEDTDLGFDIGGTSDAGDTGDEESPEPTDSGDGAQDDGLDVVDSADDPEATLDLDGQEGDDPVESPGVDAVDEGPAPDSGPGAEDVWDLGEPIDSLADEGPLLPDVKSDAGADIGETPVVPCFSEANGYVLEPLEVGPCAGEAAPCVLWKRYVWEGYTPDTLPSVPSNPSGGTDLRAPTSPAITFQGNVLVPAATKFCYEDGTFELERILRQIAPNGTDAATVGGMNQGEPVFETLVVLTETYYLVAAQGGSDIRKLDTWGWPSGWSKVGPGVGDRTFPVVAQPGRLVSGGGGGVQVVDWWPLPKGMIPNGCGGYLNGAGGPVGHSPVLLTSDLVMVADTNYTLLLFDIINLKKPGCIGGDGLLGTGAVEGRVLGEMAPTSTGGVVVGTDANVIMGTDGIYFKATAPPGVMAASPVVDADDVIYVGSTNGTFYAITLLSELKWSTETGAPIESAATLSSNGLLYVANEAPSLLALDQESGAIVWTLPLPGRPAQHSYPLTDDGVLYVTAGTDLLKVQVEPGGLAKAVWPKTHYDNQNRGNMTLQNGVPQVLPE